MLLTRSRAGARPAPAGMIEPMTRLVVAEDSVHQTATDSGSIYRGTARLAPVAGSCVPLVVSTPRAGPVRPART